MAALESELLVDCLIPSNNISSVTIETLESLRQYSFLRIILVCDMDAVVDQGAIHEIRRRFKNIIVVENTIKKGLPGALNSGLAECSAPFVMRLDDGDINVRADLFNDLCDWPEELDMKCFNIRLFAGTSKLQVVKCKLKKSLGVLSLFSRIPHPTWILKRERLKINYGLDDRRCEDYGLLVRNEFKIECCDTVATLYDVSNSLQFSEELKSTISKARIFVAHCNHRILGRAYALFFIILRVARLTISRRKYFEKV